MQYDVVVRTKQGNYLAYEFRISLEEMETDRFWNEIKSDARYVVNLIPVTGGALARMAALDEIDWIPNGSASVQCPCGIEIQTHDVEGNRIGGDLIAPFPGEGRTFVFTCGCGQQIDIEGRLVPVA